MWLIRLVAGLQVVPYMDKTTMMRVITKRKFHPVTMPL